ncbi:MAG: short-chain fatty acyl-CoA regulator family protein [Myxococcota bacterium]
MVTDPRNAALGPRLRELRTSQALTQGDAARRLGISPAYLSLLEKGKRTVQLPLLFKALDLYGVSMEAFMASVGESRVDAGLARLLDEPLLRSLNLSEDDLRGLSAEPKVVTTITALFNLYKSTRSQLDQLLAEGAAGPMTSASSISASSTSASSAASSAAAESLRRSQPPEALSLDPSYEHHPFDEVREFLERHRNHFASLEARAEEFAREHAFARRASAETLTKALEGDYGVRVAREAQPLGASVVRRFDGQTLTLSERMAEQRVKFQLAHTLALRLFDEEKIHEPILAGFEPRHTETLPLVKIHLANYFAGALLLPYGVFFDQVQRTRYDVELLARIFESSYETVAHRICNLGDPKRRGVPMHFHRVDVAGNISKRYAGDGVRFARREGSCPKLAVHLAFMTPNAVRKQYSRYPDGSTFFCFAKVQAEAEGGSLARGTIYAIGLGCRVEDAKHVTYANDRPFHDERQAVPVGTTCRFCERTDCNMRSAPSLKFAFRVEEGVRKDNVYSPHVAQDDAPPRRRRKTLPTL